MPHVHPCTKRKEDEDGAIWKDGHFVGYNETSKTYRINVAGQKYIEVSKHVTFDEEVAF